MNAFVPLPGVSKIIKAMQEEMKETGKTHVVCARCGKKGPLVAETDLETGQVTILAESLSDLGKNWSLFLREVSKKPGPYFTIVRLCSKCSRLVS